jgi:hypothetical protein
MEKIPEQGAAILIFYHAESPMDAAFFNSAIFLKKKRKIVQVVDRSVEKFPGYKSFTEAAEQTPGTVDSCVEMMKNGDLLSIFPGGMKEQFLSENYQLIWKETAGFAKVAIEAQVVSLSKYF